MHEHNYDLSGQDRPPSPGRRIPWEGSVAGGCRVGHRGEPVEREALEEGVSTGWRSGLGAKAESGAFHETDLTTMGTTATTPSRRSAGGGTPDGTLDLRSRLVPSDHLAASCTTLVSVPRNRNAAAAERNEATIERWRSHAWTHIKKGQVTEYIARVSRRIQLPSATAESLHVGAGRFAAPASRIATS